eukprot:g2147.t1
MCAFRALLAGGAAPRTTCAPRAPRTAVQPISATAAARHARRAELAAPAEAALAEPAAAVAVRCVLCSGNSAEAPRQRAAEAGVCSACLNDPSVERRWLGLCYLRLHRGLLSADHRAALEGLCTNGRPWHRQFDNLAVRLGVGIERFHEQVRDADAERALSLYCILTGDESPAEEMSELLS